MPFKKTKEGWVYDPNGKYRLPPGPDAWTKATTPTPPPTKKSKRVPPIQAPKPKKKTPQK